MDSQAILEYMKGKWDRDVIPALSRFVAIPCKSPGFDAQWEEHGYLAQAVEEGIQWARGQNIPGATFQMLKEPGRTPSLYFEIPATAGKESCPAAFFYGHMDKQPEFEGWDADKAAFKPVLKDGRLWGRGSSDDGYSFYAAVAAAQALDATGTPRPRFCGLIETYEESGSCDFPFYLAQVAPRAGNVGAVFVLDNNASDWNHVWLTSSLRGICAADLSIQMLRAGVHSGTASGIVPSTFQVLRILLDRIDDPVTGKVRDSRYCCPMPEQVRQQLQQTARILGDSLWKDFPWAGDPAPRSRSPYECLASCWEPAVSIIGADGLPSIKDAGNVLRPCTNVKISMRLPPLADAQAARSAMLQALTENVPLGAQVRADVMTEAGWACAKEKPWFTRAADAASQAVWNTNACRIPAGGSIPIAPLMQSTFPNAQMILSGCSGPDANAHGPNESIRIDYASQANAAFAMIAACIE